MTLKQRRLVDNTVKAIKLNKPYTQREIGIQSGYSKVSRNIYKPATKRYIIERLKKLGYSEEEMKERFNLGSELALAKNDLTNYMRANEDITRMQGQFKDKQEIKSTVTLSDGQQDEYNKLRQGITLLPSEN